MAEEEIVIIEEEEAAGVIVDEEKEASEFEDRFEEKETPKSKKKLFLAVGGVSLIFISVLAFLLLGPEEEIITKKRIEIRQEQTQENEKIKKMSSSELESMIKRANILYEKGLKKDALRLYEKIATFSESISHYNLGVAQMQDKQYKMAIKSFDLAIASEQNMCVSAINAAVSSLKLDDEIHFKYYINLAHSYLSLESNTPMYSYYYALINFYQENYLEALSPLRHRSANEYENLQDQLQAKIHVLFSSYNKAVENIEKSYKDESALSLGLLYANLGDLILAKKYLTIAILQGINPSKAQVALALVNLKSGQIKDAATLLESTTDMFPDTVYTHYPIEVTLKDSLFDVDLAQNNFHKNIIHNLSTRYQILFYFSPFKIFNANQSISYIRKGNAQISIDNISNASSHLSKSARLSNVNLNIAQAIQLALDFHLYEANERLVEMLKLYPRHSILQYNLALTYAQLGQISLAHKHFLKSYHLDAKNYLSGIYASMTGKLINQENEKFNLILSETLTLEDDSEEFEFYRALIHYKDSNFPATAHWLETLKKDRPLYFAFEMLIAMSMNKDKAATMYAQKLTKLLPNDILPHLLYIDAAYSKEEKKMFARKTMAYLKKQKFSMKDFYYGPFITKYLYTQYAQITGGLYPLRKKIQKKLQSEKNSPVGVIKSLALVNIYTQDFEEAYTLYNQLIDDYKQRSAHTLFLAAIASIGASHHANAIALLELARRKSPHHNESRFGLGLLYLQVENNEGAVISFENMTGTDFQSQFFNFKISSAP
ncbi:hypothetical protein JHD50_11225 [Sulfurimonas sp. MAG313]|nr:tetratricopeptide repeat protein [Sulfurimonas sp. MAG313]MDF1881862.1 hypothetical protein [Sulfurimonas sp. MAG313]